MVDKWDDMEIEITNDPKRPPSPTWDQRQIEELMRPGKGDQSPKARTARRREAVRRR
jgi:hypothetical protein